MNRPTPTRVLSVLASLAVLTIGVAFAQDMGNDPVPGTTYTTGIVQSYSHDAVTIREDSGVLNTLLIDAGTIGANQLAEGQRVRIDFERNAYGEDTAKVIQAGAAPPTQVAEAEPQVTISQSPIAEPETTAVVTETVAVAEVEPAPEPMMEREAAETLPATASRLPALVLLGVIALGAALAVRLVR